MVGRNFWKEKGKKKKEKNIPFDLFTLMSKKDKSDERREKKKMFA